MVLLSTTIGLGSLELAVRAFIPVRDVGPSWSVYNPKYSKVHKKNFSTTRITPEFTIRFTTNSLGDRGPEPLTGNLERPIVFIGDSFTEGYGVSDGEEFPEIIRRALGGIPVRNMGIGGRGQGYWLRYLMNEGDQLDPRMLVLQLCQNDFGDNMREGYKLTDDGTLVDLGAPPPAAYQRGLQILMESVPGLSNSYLFGLMRQVAVPAPVSNPDPDPEEVRRIRNAQHPLTQRLVEEIIALARRRTWPIVLLTVQLEAEQLALITEVAERSDVQLLSIPTRQVMPDIHNRVDAHWNALGHARVAKLLLDEVFTPKRALQEGPLFRLSETRETVTDGDREVDFQP